VSEVSNDSRRASRASSLDMSGPEHSHAAHARAAAQAAILVRTPTASWHCLSPNDDSIATPRPGRHMGYFMRLTLRLWKQWSRE
jgi:hypothetical protein